MEHESFHDVRHGNEPFQLKLFRPQNGFWAVSYRDKHYFFEAVPRRLKAILLSISSVMEEEGEGGIETLAGRVLKALIGSRRELETPPLMLSRERMAILLRTERRAEQRGLPFTRCAGVHRRTPPANKHD
jgi:hypothetical protein